MQPRLSAAIAATHMASWVSAAGGRGGTSLPGLVGLRVEPLLVEKLARQLDSAFVVAGTNGKTTTTAWLGAALRADRRHLIHNREGSNMLRGVATSLARRSTLGGALMGRRPLMGLFEVDEAALPGILGQVRPSILLLTNLFRDQLDRYSELALVADHWKAPIRALPAASTLVLNADDPLIASLGVGVTARVLSFGVDSWPGDPSTQLARSADSLYCPACGAELEFSSVSYAHLGHYRCHRCGLGRPAATVSARVLSEGVHGTSLTLSTGGQSIEARLEIPGRYNVYNAVAAIAGAVAGGVPFDQAVPAVTAAKGAFGRAETIEADGKEVRLYLIKNPTGADEVLRVLAGGLKGGELLTLLSDNAADGLDVSWIWDAEFELLAGWGGRVTCGGTRAEDMALRLKYAGIVAPITVVTADVGQAVRGALEGTANGGTLVIVATYTAMLAARDALARAGHVRQYWQRAGA
jgi:UDP-N-acetylmuramyl tripeptide synthase